MQDSDIPIKFPIPFANGAGPTFIRPIPTASQIGITPGAASLTDGFPPLNALLIAAGGIPPAIQDENGILFQITQWLRWHQAGAPLTYDSTFQTAIAGYPAGTKVISAVTAGLVWYSTADNNATNPDTGGAGWTRLPAYDVRHFVSSGSLTIPAGVFRANFKLWGPGAGSGGSASTGAAGGAGAGGYTEKTINVIPGATYTVALGLPGVGGGTALNGTGGGTSTITGTGISLSTGGAQAGQGAGAGGSGGGGSGGTASGGDLNMNGGTGENGFVNGTLYVGGAGGASPFGGSISSITVGTPFPGAFPGGGAGGGANSANGNVGGSSYARIELH